MRRLMAGITSLILLASLLTGCTPKMSNDNALFRSAKVRAAANDGKISDERSRRAYSEFVFDIVGRCAGKSGNSNILVSPDSIFFMLEMAAAGADGATLDQMIDTMVPGSTNEDGLAFGVDHMREILSDSVTVANSMWLNKGSQFYKDYVDYIKENLGAEAEEIRFDDSGVRKVNEWVDDRTKGMIPEIINGFDPNDKLILINAIAFEGTWKERISERSVAPYTFNNANGTVAECPFMSTLARTVVEDDRCTGVLKDYADGKYTFLALLPNVEDVDINDFMAQMTAEDYWDLWDNRTKDAVLFYMPEFSSEYDVLLNDTLSDMGMTDVFTASADLSNISDSDLYISKVIHKTFISVDHEGTRAAAVTAGGVTSQSGTVVKRMLYFDRPFAYAIIDKDTGLPLFLGTVNNL